VASTPLLTANVVSGTDAETQAVIESFKMHQNTRFKGENSFVFAEVMVQPLTP